MSKSNNPKTNLQTDYYIGYVLGSIFTLITMGCAFRNELPLFAYVVCGIIMTIVNVILNIILYKCKKHEQRPQQRD